ncbi:MAG: TolB family protein [Solirubrobacteraceae bacterium]
MRGLLTLMGVMAALVAAAPAAADSLVFIKSNNVWLANADGSGEYQVTLDGSAGSPYSSPSQADDGTIVALRTPLGGRPQIWRMHQNGGLLNTPINTPAPGTGAIDARVSPDGKLVAYWFVTEVSTGTCLYCFDVSSRALISRSDQFTNPDAVGTPNTGSLPSWMSNDTLLLSNGNATQWYYKLGTPEGVEWWGDSDNCGACIPPAIVGLTDGEVSRDGQRIALVRGDNNETIVLYKANGAPPAPPSPECAFNGAVGGKFSGPTWSQDGMTLAWQEGNGIWSDQIPDITNCATIGTSKLIVAGGTEPDFGPAAVNPGARPTCGNPGNPTTCKKEPPPPHPVSLGHRLGSLLASCASALKRMAIHGLLRKHRLTLAFEAPGAGTLVLGLTTTGKHPVLVASARVVFRARGKRNVVLTLTSKGRGALRHARLLRTRLKVTFTPRGARGTASTTGVTLSK